MLACHSVERLPSHLLAGYVVVAVDADAVVDVEGNK
jgi:hypothetical protein